MTLTNLPVRPLVVARDRETLDRDAVADSFDGELDRIVAALEPPLEDARILVVDDNARVAVLMCRLLEREGFRHVTSAGDGRRALDILIEHPPDVIVLDVHLPHADGFEVLREIQRHDERVGRVTGVLAVSGDAVPTTCHAMLLAGADDFISRPFENSEFSLRVRRIAIRTRALQRSLGYARILEERIREISRG